MTRFFLLLSCILPIFFSCSSIRKIETKPKQNIQPLPAIKNNPLKLTFAGDIMAHKVNFSMKNYSLIYADIQQILWEDDLSFANLETPVCASRPYQTYPNFNVQPAYAQAAINAGFDVFSLANNHTNDQYLEGIKATADFFAALKQNFIYSAGIKEAQNGKLTYQIIKTQGWTILFAALTELVNFYAHTSWFDFYPFTEQGKTALKKDLEQLRKENACDIFILSVHTADTEYIQSISAERREHFYNLLDSGVDIVWANHPHVSKDWELVKTDKSDKLIMYSMGNTISGQNLPLNLKNPEHPLEYTGTSILLQVEISETGILRLEPLIIATYIDDDFNFIIKRLTDDFVQAEKPPLRAYYAKRLELMKKIKGIITWR